jgi:predicted nucleotidyltransferase
MEIVVKKLKIYLQKNKELIDIIIFGSYVKNKGKANDIDIAMLSENKDVDKQELKKQIEQISNKTADIQILTLHDYGKFLWLTLIKEGFSIKHNKYLHQLYGIKPVILYFYSLKQLPISKKVMFERALKNFKNIEKLSNRVVLVPIQYSGEFSDLLRYWDIDVEAKEYALLPLVRKEEL